MLYFFAKSFIERTLYIVEIYQVIKLYTHTRLFFTAQDWLSIFQYIALKANQLCATRVGKLLVSTSSSFYTYSHIFLRHHHIRQLLVVALKTIVSFSFFSNLRICKAIALERTYLYNEITWKTHTHEWKTDIVTDVYTKPLPRKQ